MDHFRTNQRSERGQGLMEYTLIVFLAALGLGGMRTTNIGDELAMSWSKAVECVNAPVLLWVLISAETTEALKRAYLMISWCDHE